MSQPWPQTMIGVSASLWKNKPDYATYESEVSSALKQKNWNHWGGPPIYTQATTGGFLQPANPAGFEYTLLAVLVHEAGHVIWRDQDQFRLQGCYLSWSEVASRKDDHDRFHAFGILAKKSKSGRRSSFQEIYLDGEWASLFAAVGPDEDFIETYKLIVLNYSNPRLESLIVVDAASGASVDVMTQFRSFSTNLNRKQSCFANALNALP